MPTLALEPGSLIFVTGINGLIGSHVADQLLLRGYNVRGAVRNVEKSAWLKEYLTNKHKNATLELVAIPDMTVDGCYDDAVKGTNGFVHVASPMGGEDPHTTIPIAIKGGLNALRAAAQEPLCTRVIFTSSSIAATFPKPNTRFSIDASSYNEAGIEAGWHPAADAHPRLRSLWLYAALKTETEKAAWKWMREHRPAFALSTVLPNVNWGRVLVPAHQGAPSTIAWAKALFDADGGFDLLAQIIPPQWYIDTVDCALLHVSALIHADVDGERLFGFAEPFSWNGVLALCRALFPAHAFPADVAPAEDLMTVPNARAEEVLRWVKGAGWTPLADSLRAMGAEWVRN